MATKAEHNHLDRAHFNNFKKHIPGYKKKYDEAIEWLLGIGGIQVSTTFEHALAHKGGHVVISEDHADLSNGADAKLSSTRWCSNGASYSAPVTNIHGKTGNLLVQVYERQLSKYYLFKIPHSEYQDIPKSSNIEIPFESNGVPRVEPVGNRKYANWWDYQVKSFKELAK